MSFKKNIFKRQVELTIRNDGDDGDGIGFNFGEFFIWKNSSHKYFIKNKSGQYWCGSRTGWNKHFYSTDLLLRQVLLYNTLKMALTVACRLLNIELQDPDEIISLEIEYDRFDLMELE